LVFRYIDCGCGHKESYSGPKGGTVGEHLRQGGFNYGIDIYGSPTGVGAHVTEEITGPRYSLPSSSFSCAHISIHSGGDNIRIICESLPMPVVCWGCADLDAEVYCSKCEWTAYTYDEHPGFFCREVNFT